MTGVKLGDEQFDGPTAWEERGCSRSSGMGVEPGLSDVFARYAADHLFSRDRRGRRARRRRTSWSRATSSRRVLDLDDDRGVPEPAGVWEKDRGWFTPPPFSEPETFVFPEGIGAVECVNVEHEEVLLIPRWVDCKRVTFKYGLGEEFIDVLEVLHLLGLDLDRSRSRCAAPRFRLATWSRRCCPIPRRSVTRCTADVRGHLGDRQRQGRRTPRGVPVPRGRQRGDDEP